MPKRYVDLDKNSCRQVKSIGSGGEKDDVGEDEGVEILGPQLVFSTF